MSLDATLARITELQTLLAPRTATPTAAPGTSSFSSTLAAAQTGTGTTATTAAHALTPSTSTLATTATAAPTGGTNAGMAAVAAAAQEVGVREEPPGSNDSPRIAQFRQATAGSPGPGPWCSYFVSWAARQAGAPLGDVGQGFGRVDDVWSWAQSTGRATDTPQPGELIVWDEHIGIVESVDPNGTVHTIEGNSSDQVARRGYPPGSRPPVGYVRLG